MQKALKAKMSAILACYQDNVNIRRTMPYVAAENGSEINLKDKKLRCIKNFCAVHYSQAWQMVKISFILFVRKAKEKKDKDLPSLQLQFRTWLPFRLFNFLQQSDLEFASSASSNQSLTIKIHVTVRRVRIEAVDFVK